MSSSSQTCTICNETRHHYSVPVRPWNCHNVSGVEGPMCHKCENKPMNVLNCALAGEYECDCFEYCSLYFELLVTLAPFAKETEAELTKRIIKAATEDDRKFHCEGTPMLIAALAEALPEDERLCSCSGSPAQCFQCQCSDCGHCVNPDVKGCHHERFCSCDEGICPRCKTNHCDDDNEHDNRIFWTSNTDGADVCRSCIRKEDEEDEDS